MKHIKAKKLFVAALAAGLFAASCSPVELTYIQDAPRNNPEPIVGHFGHCIQPNDLLYIYVESESPEATLMFNQETNKIATNSGGVMNPGSSSPMGYLVNSNGDIVFPVLKKIHVQGMTHEELADTLRNRLINEGHILDAVVTVKLMNFTVYVIGDVSAPQKITSNGERLTIFEALSMVGDIKVSGQRTNVTVVREENGVRTIGELDLTTKDVFSSPYYYLHQNDVVYVEPTNKKKREAERDMAALSYVSAATSLLSVITSIVLLYTNLSR